MSANRFQDPAYLCSRQVVKKESKKALLTKGNIDALSKAVAHYIFRDGPVEDMHSDGKLSENDMMTLNKYMVNRLAGLFSMMMDGDWGKLYAVFEHAYKHCGMNWDKAEPDTGEIEAVFESYCRTAQAQDNQKEPPRE